MQVCVAGQIILFLISRRHCIRLNTKKYFARSQSGAKLAKFPRVILLTNHTMNYYVVTNFENARMV